jgi:membrane-bound lytic murein transglycosylase D
LIALVSIAQIQAQDYSPNTLSIDSLVPDNQADESAKSIDSIDNIDNIDSIDNIDTVSTEETAVSSGFSGPEELASIPIMPETIISAGILVDGLEFDIPMPWGQQEFEKFRASFLTPGGRKWLTAVMQNSLAYLDYVEERIETYGLPKELAFLPVIESEYSPYAVSRSGATGIWQFMKNSIAGYGLSISDWTDDRKDFMKSTDAALRKLRDNNSVLNDWLLALAAYNAGVGAVTRAIRSTNSETVDFWYLYDRKILSKEPMSYIPKFLAVASILRYPELHGFPGEWGDRHAWETIETTRQVDMNILAQKAKIPLEVLKKGNAELKYHITPPSSSHVVKVPAPMADTARAILSDTSSPLFKYDIYTVKSGDTMSEIAQRFGTPLAIILQANPGVRADRIRIGQALVIPHLPGRSVAKSQNSPGESLNFSSSYTVKSGDTLWDIAIRFGISPEVLADKNGISMNSTLRIGQRLKVPPL